MTTRAALADAPAVLIEQFDRLIALPGGVKRLRELILQLAVQGKLLPQDPTDEPASELLKRIESEKKRLVREGKVKPPKPLPPLAEDEVPFVLPSGWKWCRIWDIAQIITSGSRDWAKYYSDVGAIFVTMGNLSNIGYTLRTDSLRYVCPPKTGEGLRTRLLENDLLISITGDVGNLGLIPPNFGEPYINQHICLLRFMPSCQNLYFPQLMRSSLAKSQFNAPQRGVKNSFRLGDVGEMIIPLPPLTEQHRIVERVDALMTLCDQIEAEQVAVQRHGQALLASLVYQVANNPIRKGG